MNYVYSLICHQDSRFARGEAHFTRMCTSIHGSTTRYSQVVTPALIKRAWRELNTAPYTPRTAPHPVNGRSPVSPPSYDGSSGTFDSMSSSTVDDGAITITLALNRSGAEHAWRRCEVHLSVEQLSLRQ